MGRHARPRRSPPRVYQLDRTNVAVADPNDPTRSILVDGTAHQGVELGAQRPRRPTPGACIGGYAYQDGEITSDAVGDRRGRRDAARISRRNTFSLWNRYDFPPRWAPGSA